VTFGWNVIQARQCRTIQIAISIVTSSCPAVAQLTINPCDLSSKSFETRCKSKLIHLCVAPQKVYLNFQHRKRTKDQWARDDPSFLILLAIFLLLSSVVFALVTRIGVVAGIKFVVWVVGVDTIAAGIVVATFFWLMTNKYLMSPTAGRGFDVEWGYAFDVHLNALFPTILILHVLQLPLVSVIGHGFFGCLIGNTLWLLALCYYVYITFLGYKSLPFLRFQQVILYPMTALLFMYILSICMQWNFTRGIIDFYHFRVSSNHH